MVILPHKLQKLKRFFFSTSGFKLRVISLDIHSGTIFVHFLDLVLIAPMKSKQMQVSHKE